MAASAASGENGSGSGINNRRIGAASKLLMAWRIAKAGIKNKLAAAAWQSGV
jgi:hypothetical protein